MMKQKIPVYYFRIITAVYMAVLFYVSVIPKVVPGPSTPLKEAVHNSLHIPAYAVLTILLYLSIRPLPLGWIAGTAFAYGLLMEILQSFIPERTASLMDLLRNVLGIGLASFLIIQWQVFKTKNGRTP